MECVYPEISVLIVYMSSDIAHEVIRFLPPRLVIYTSSPDYTKIYVYQDKWSEYDININRLESENVIGSHVITSSLEPGWSEYYVHDLRSGAWNIHFIPEASSHPIMVQNMLYVMTECRLYNTHTETYVDLPFTQNKFVHTVIDNTVYLAEAEAVDRHVTVYCYNIDDAILTPLKPLSCSRVIALVNVNHVLYAITEDIFHENTDIHEYTNTWEWMYFDWDMASHRLKYITACDGVIYVYDNDDSDNSWAKPCIRMFDVLTWEWSRLLLPNTIRHKHIHGLTTI